MAQINLRPEVGEELATAVTTVLDNEFCESMQGLYEACRSLGDENDLVGQIKEKYNKMQEKYNAEAIPAIDRFKQVMSQYTDWATYVAKLQVDTSVKDVEVGEVNTGAFDAAHDL